MKPSGSHNTDTFDQLVCFRLGEEELSLPVRSIQEIIRMPAVTPVPGAPASVRGIANLRGGVLSLVDLRAEFGLPALGEDSESQVVVVNHRGTPTGVIVDRVSEVLHVSPSQIACPETISTVARTDWIRGIANFNNGDRVVLVLDEEKIFPAHTAEPLDYRHDSSAVSTDSPPAASEDVSQFVVFRLADEEYGMPIGEVREVVKPGTLTVLPNSAQDLLGIMSLRHEIIPIISLRRKFHLERREPVRPRQTARRTSPENGRVIIVETGGLAIGFHVDGVSDVLKVSSRQIEPHVGIPGEDSGIGLDAVAKLEDGRRLVMLLDSKKILSEDSLESLRKTSQNMGKTGEKIMESKIAGTVPEETHLVCFQLGDEDYGIDIMKVQEIVRISSITEVPGAPPYVEGIVNLRGKVLPVIDLRKRFGLPVRERHEQSRILVVDIGGTTTGLVVDGVSEVRRLPVKDLADPPQILTQGQRARFITAVGKLQDKERLLILIDVDALLTKDEETNLAATMNRETSLVPQAPDPETPGATRGEESGQEDLVEFIVESVERGESI